MKADAVVCRLRSFLPAELRKARRQLAIGNDPDRAVHEVRKSIKRLRAALRLAQELAPERTLEAVGTPLRKAAHALGPLRDHLVLGQTGKNVAQRDEEPPRLPPGPAGPRLPAAASVPSPGHTPSPASASEDRSLHSSLSSRTSLQIDFAA